MADKNEEKPVEWKAADRKSAAKPIVAADGHVVLSKEDIEKRDA